MKITCHRSPVLLDAKLTTPGTNLTNQPALFPAEVVSHPYQNPRQGPLKHLVVILNRRGPGAYQKILTSLREPQFGHLPSATAMSKATRETWMPTQWDIPLVLPAFRL